MISLRFLPLVSKQIVRRPLRAALTVAGVALAMFLFCGLTAMRRGAEASTNASAKDVALVVYRKDRYCPFTSILPERYQERIARVPGVASVVPVRIVVTNCRTSLDVVTFRGVPEESLARDLAPRWTVLAGAPDAWAARRDAVFVGETLAARRGWKVGDAFKAAGLECVVAGILRSDDPQDQNVAYAHLGFLQQALDGRLGQVTQFNVRVDDPAKAAAVAQAVDAEFATDEAPTATFPEKAFAARAAHDALAVIRFTEYLAWGCAAAVLALVANAIVLMVQEKVRDHAILQTLGYSGRLIAAMVVGESLALALAGGLLGAGGAWLFAAAKGLAVSNEGVTLAMDASPAAFLVGMGVAAAMGVLAGLLPAWQAGRIPIAQCFRAV